MFQRLAMLVCCSGLFIWFLVIIGKESAASIRRSRKDRYD